MLALLRPHLGKRSILGGRLLGPVAVVSVLEVGVLGVATVLQRLQQRWDMLGKKVLHLIRNGTVGRKEQDVFGAVVTQS